MVRLVAPRYAKAKQLMSRNDFTFDRFCLAQNEREIFITFKSIRFFRLSMLRNCMNLLYRMFIAV